MVIVGVSLVVVGAFAPWVTVEGALSQLGFEGDGVLTLALAFAVLGVLIVARLRRRQASRRTIAGCAVLVLILAAFNVIDILGTDFEGLDGGVGWGLWITLGGAVLLLAVTLRDWRSGTPGSPDP